MSESTLDSSKASRIRKAIALIHDAHREMPGFSPATRALEHALELAIAELQKANQR